MSHALEQYLDQFAFRAPEEPLCRQYGPYAQAVVVPLCGEDYLVDGLLDSLQVAARDHELPTLVILVVNDDTRTAMAYRETNRSFLNRIRDVQKWGPTLRIQPLDRTQFQGACGVGTARKIGSDLALSLYKTGFVASPWIHTTDADARVAPDYFQLTPKSAAPWGLGPMELGAFVHPFSHEMIGELGYPMQLYDRYLHYYVAGLKYAGSPFAYQTVGSTISFSAQAYAQVRGFPKKDAGEDFYFLHKLAKVAYVWEGGGAVRLVCRPSDRVPFGTGQSIAKIQELVLAERPYTTYDPRVFEELANWYRCLNRLAAGENWDCTETLTPPVRTLIENLGAKTQHEIIQRTRPTLDARLRHWHTWFDGFKTLKFIHGLRDSLLPCCTFPFEFGTDFQSRFYQDFQSTMSVIRGERFQPRVGDHPNARHP